MRRARVAGAMVLFVLGLAPAARAATWTADPIPAPTAKNGALMSVSCVTGTCEAVGSAVNSADNQVTVAEQWTGSAWKLQTTPNPAPNTEPYGNTFNELTAVSCSDASACSALEFDTTAYLFGDTTLHIERWNGSAWSMQTIPMPSGEYAVLNGISCAGPSMCMAVGSYGTSPAAYTSHPLVELWNGTTWTSEPAAIPAGASSGLLNGVSCKSTTVCMAVGSSTSSGGVQSPLAEMWNGKLHIELPASPPGSSYSVLSAISCSASTTCTAVGQSNGSSGFGEQVSGSTWKAEPISGKANMDAVSCTAASACSAVGPYGTVIERWNGSAWSSESSASSEAFATFVGISCTAAKSCTAVGATGDGFRGQAPGPARQHLAGAARHGVLGAALTYALTLGTMAAESWNGSSWTAQAPVNRVGTEYSEARGVSCVTSTTTCMMVGDYVDLSHEQQLALTVAKTSSGWKVFPFATPAGWGTAGLSGVSCPAANACVAVGGVSGGSNNAGLYGIWNGTSWTTATAPAPNSSSAWAFTSVSCHAATACVAVGVDLTNGAAVAETWNGTAWTVRSVPTPVGGRTPSLSSVSCALANTCKAVGGYYTSTGTAAMAVSWNGTTWTLDSAPQPAGTTYGGFDGVSCKTINTCTAGGSWLDTADNTHGPLLDRWNGTAWTQQSPPPSYGTVYGISCATTTACTTVSNFGSADWNGTSWSDGPALAKPKDGGAPALSAISCTAAQTCLAVGISGHLTLNIALVEQYS